MTKVSPDRFHGQLRVHEQLQMLVSLLLATFHAVLTGAKTVELFINFPARCSTLPLVEELVNTVRAHASTIFDASVTEISSRALPDKDKQVRPLIRLSGVGSNDRDSKPLRDLVAEAEVRGKLNAFALECAGKQPFHLAEYHKDTGNIVRLNIAWSTYCYRTLEPTLEFHLKEAFQKWIPIQQPLNLQIRHFRDENSNTPRIVAFQKVHTEHDTTPFIDPVVLQEATEASLRLFKVEATSPDAMTQVLKRMRKQCEEIIDGLANETVIPERLDVPVTAKTDIASPNGSVPLPNNQLAFEISWRQACIDKFHEALLEDFKSTQTESDKSKPTFTVTFLSDESLFRPIIHSKQLFDRKEKYLLFPNEILDNWQSTCFDLGKKQSRSTPRNSLLPSDPKITNPDGEGQKPVNSKTRTLLYALGTISLAGLVTAAVVVGLR